MLKVSDLYLGKHAVKDDYPLTETTPVLFDNLLKINVSETVRNAIFMINRTLSNKGISNLAVAGDKTVVTTVYPKEQNAMNGDSKVSVTVSLVEVDTKEEELKQIKIEVPFYLSTNAHGRFNGVSLPATIDRPWKVETEVGTALNTLVETVSEAINFEVVVEVNAYLLNQRSTQLTDDFQTFTVSYLPSDSSDLFEHISETKVVLAVGKQFFVDLPSLLENDEDGEFTKCLFDYHKRTATTVGYLERGLHPMLGAYTGANVKPKDFNQSNVPKFLSRVLREFDQKKGQRAPVLYQIEDKVLRIYNRYYGVKVGRSKPRTYVNELSFDIITEELVRNLPVAYVTSRNLGEEMIEVQRS